MSLTRLINDPMKRFRLLALAALAVALAPAFAMAASLDLGSTASVGANAGSGTSVNVGTDVNVGASGSAGSGTASSSAQGSHASGSSTGSGILTITAQDASDDSGTQSAVTSSASVANDADFAAYAKSQLRANSNLKEVDSDDSSVAVKYTEPGRFLGVFPVTMTATAKVAADGSITVSHPWYYFLTASSADDAAFKAAIAQSTVGMLHTTPSAASEGATSTASARASLTAQQKAAILATIRAALATSASTNTTASTSAGY